MHVGANISIPTRDARDLPQMAPQPQRVQQDAAVDPFEVSADRVRACLCMHPHCSRLCVKVP